MKTGLTLFTFALMILPGQVCAGSATPRPADKQDALDRVERELGAAKQKSEDLAEQRAQQERELGNLKDKVIPLSRSVQDAQQKLEMLKGRIAGAEAEKQELEQTLGENRGVLSRNISAALRMRRMPGETLFMQSATPVHTAQTAMLLQNAVPQVQRRLDKLNTDIKRLNELKSRLIKDRETQSRTLAQLKEEQKELDRLIDKRQSLYAQTGESLTAQKEKISALAEESQNLEDLIERVRSENATRLARATPRPQLKPEQPAPAQSAPPVQDEEPGAQPVSAASQPPPVPPQANPPASRPNSWPVAGRISVSYGQPDDLGAPSKGVKFAAAPGALVTAPEGGTIKYSGPFKNYGQLLIIEHDGGWHSLVAGLSKIDTMVGQQVSTGEPLGQMPETPSKLYYELRHNGRTVNPSQKIKGLS